MLDAITGALTFERPPATIEPSLTRDRFLSTSLVSGATTHVENEPYHSWKLAGHLHSNGVEFAVVLWFHGQWLAMLSLMDSDPRFGKSWADHTREKELARKASHDAWLSRCLVAHGDFTWGSIWSGHDERAGFSEIVIRYSAAE